MSGSQHTVKLLAQEADAEAPGLHRVDVGASPTPLLLVHGFASSSRLWTEVIDRLGTSHRCVAPDLRGFGRSPPAKPDCVIADHASDLERLLVELDLSGVVLAGHSMGGKIAMALGARCPERIKALVLLASSPPTPSAMSEAERRRLLDAYGDRNAMEALVDRIARRRLRPSARAAFVEDNLGVSENVWRWWIVSGLAEDISASLAGLAAPVILAGSDDPVLSLDVQSSIADQLSAPPPRVLAGVGHLLPLEAPAQCSDVLRSLHARLHPHDSS